MISTIILGVLLVGVVTATEQQHNAMETEMFAIPISPNMFNWTYQEFDQQYRFHASLDGKPELPSWLRYIYSGRHHSGFIFGTPPRGTKSPVHLKVIGLNRQDYETRRLLLTIKIHAKEKMARHEVEMKIDNLNVEDLLDEHKMTSLKNIFREKLWLESSQDLYATFLASAIDLGARLPLKPNEGEGLVVRLGSAKPFSEELKRLRAEVKPLSRLPVCPREYKKTTVERLFKSADFTLDWCNFRLYNAIYTDKTIEHLEYLAETPVTMKTDKINDDQMFLDGRIWSAPSIRDLPSRSYVREFTVAVLVPILLMLVSVAALTAVLCFHYAGIAHKPGNVELCRYETNNTEQTQVLDNLSSKSLGVSPNNSLARPYSPKSTTNLAGNYNRPQPPPYMGSTSNSLHHRKSGNTEKTPPEIGHTPEHRNLVLEESLKLLNEAKINGADYINSLNVDCGLKEPIVDANDGCDDYVPIKSDITGYVPMKPDLDDIVVPDLAKFGLGGINSAAF